MKRILAILLALSLLLSLCACAQKAPEQTEAPANPTTVTEPEPTAAPAPVPDANAFHFTRKNFPVLDGSTSMVPLGQAITSVLLGESREDVSDLIQFNRTTQSFRNLREGLCDIVIAAEPQASVFEEMNNFGFPYEIETIAKEALVFVVNEGNGVDNLTTQQIRDIYSGKITNWKDVGGADMPIEAFQRNATSGSQVMMEKLVMQGTPMAEVPEANVPGAMGELIQSVKNYDNSANAIGYTVFYYAKDMQMADGLKILKVDGVLPEAETLRSDAYPFINGYYCCIGGNTPDDSPARKLYDWLLTEAGQRLLRLEGYVSDIEAGEAPQSGTDVYADYTNYTPNGGSPAKYTQLPGGTPKYLTASRNYGTLHPYTGSLIYTSEWEYEYQSGSLLGFYNEQGVLLCQPSYHYIYTCPIQDSDDFIWIMGTVSDGHEEAQYRCTFASSDGSFVAPNDYASITIIGPWIMGIKDYDSRSFDLYDRNYQIVKTEQDFIINGKVAVPETYENSCFVCSVLLDEDYNTDYYLLDENGSILLGPQNYITLTNGMTLVYESDLGYTAVRSDGTPFTVNGEDRFNYIFSLNDKLLEVNLKDETSVITDLDGNVLVSGFHYCGASDSTHIYAAFDDGRQFLDENGQPTFKAPAFEDWDYTGMGNLYSRYDSDRIAVKNFETGKQIDIPNGLYISTPQNADYLYIYCSDGNSPSTTLCLLDGQMHLTVLNGMDMQNVTDLSTGETYLIVRNSYGFSGDNRIFTPDGKTQLFRASGNVEVDNGFFTVTNDWGFTAYDKSGNLVLCYPFFGLNAGD